MTQHKDVTLDDIHALAAKVYADIATRDADTGFQVAVNVNKIVRVDSPSSFYLLVSIGPTVWVEISNTGTNTFLKMLDTPSNYVGNAGNIAQVNAGENALEFGQALRATDSPTFVKVSVGNNGLVVGASTPFSDNGGVLTLQNIDAIDAATEATLEAAIDALVNLTSIQGQVIALSGPLTVEATSFLNQDLTTDANPTFKDLVLTGNLTVQGTTVTLDATTLLVEDKNIELGAVASPTDVTADGGGITLKGATDKTIRWLNATNRWTFNQGIDLQGNNLISTGGLVSADVISGNINITTGNLQLSGNTLSSISGDIDITTDTGGVFKFESNALRAGQTTTNYIELGHNGVFSFISAVGAGGLEIAFDGAVRAKFNKFGHLLLKTNTDQKDILILKTFNNLNETGLAWQNSIVGYTGTIYRKDIGSGRADLHFAGGFNNDINLLTDSFKILGGSGVEGNLEIFGDLKITSGSPAAGNVLTTDALGNATWEIPNPGAGGWVDDGTVVRLGTSTDKVGIGTAAPDASSVLDLVSTTKGFLPPRMTTTQRDVVVSPAAGLGIYNTTVNKSEVRTATAWKTILTEDIGQTVEQETFASTNARFFGELGLPQVQDSVNWTDIATGSATIDLFNDPDVFGEAKQVVRHNDDVSDGSTTSQRSLTAQNWTDINAFGASYSGASRLDTVNGTSGFFSGLQANAAENPLASGNRRYGISFDNNGGNLRVTEPDTGGTTVTFDGTGGNPLVTFDEWVRWECVVPAGLGAAQFYINSILTTFAPTFITNTGGLGTRALISSGSTSGTNRISYHDNFGVTIYEESATKTLVAATMTADVAQVNIPEGRRNYTIILPDGNPREIGSVLRVVANNLFGTITLENEDPSVPEILYNGLRSLVIDVFVKETISGINTVNSGNVYLGFKADDIDRAKTIFAQLNSNIDQLPTTTNPEVITYSTQDAINGVGHSTTINPGELEILPGLGGTYFIMAQPQVGKDQGSTRVDLDMFLQVNTGSGFVDESNSNIKLAIKDQDVTDVIVSGFTIQLDAGDKIRMMQRISDSGVGMGLKNTNPEVGPPSIPRTPSIIFTMYRVGGK